MKRFLKMKTQLIVCLFIIFLSAPNAAHAKFRFGLLAGGWMGSFGQSGSSNSTSVNIAPAIGTEGFLGFSIAQLIFFEWSPTYLWVQKFAYSADKTGDASYLSLLALNVGVKIPVIPLEVYVGGENGTFAFSSGSADSFGGNAIKGGVSFTFPPGKVNFEYRRHFLNSDNGGALPSAVSTSLNTYFLTLGIGFY